MKSNAFLNLVVVVILAVLGYWAVVGTDLFKNLSFNEQSLVGAPGAVITATLGTNSIGSILDDGSTAAINTSPYTMPADGGKAVSISVYIESIEPGSQFGLAIYEDASGQPGKLVANTPTQTLDSSVTAGWKTVPITVDLKANTKYWLAYNATAVASKKNLLRYVPATPGSNVWKFIGLGVWPADYPTAPGSTGSGSNLISIYVTYEKPDTTTTSTSYTSVAPSTSFLVGSRITVSQGPINIRSSAGRSATILGTQATGALGSIIAGPVKQNGLIWWQVNYDNSPDGWTTGAYQYVIGVVSTSSGGGTSTTTSTTTPTVTPFSFRLVDGSNKTIVQGASATSSVMVQKIAGTAEVVNFSVSGLPTGVGGTFSPTSCTPNTSCPTTLTLTAQASASIGTRTVNIIGSSNSTSTNTNFALTIDALPVVSTSTPATGTYKAGDRIRVTQGSLNIRSDSQIDSSTLLGTQPTDALGTVVSGPKAGIGNSLIWWNINYDTGVDGWNSENYITRAGTTVPVNLDFNFTNPVPSSVTQGSAQSVPLTLNITQSNAAQNIGLAISGLPAGVSGVFSPTTCTSLASGPSICNLTLGLTALSSALAGSYTATIIASGGGKTATTPLPITIISTVIVTPPSTTFNTGDEVEVVPGTGTLNVRSGPGTSYAIVGTKTDGNTGIIQTDTNNGILTNSYNWWKVDFGGLVGWSVEAFLRLFQNPPPPPPPSDDSAVPIGFNVEFPWESDRSEMFTDVIRFSRGFEGPALDANGWPLGDSYNYVMSEAARIDLGARSINNYNKVYTLTFNGKADIGVVYGNANCPTGKTCDPNYSSGKVYYDSGRNLSVSEIRFDKSISSGQAYKISFNNSRRTTSSVTGSGISNVKLLRPGYTKADGSYDQTQTFTNEFLNATKDFKAIRLMNYSMVNWCYENPQYLQNCDTDEKLALLGADKMMNWSERPNPNWPTANTKLGGSVEWMVELANVSGLDLWINIPHVADDDYVRGLANYLKVNLNSNVNVYLEWSNEVWNRGQFAQGEYNDNMAAAAGICSRCYTAKRSIEISNIFRSVFGDATMPNDITPNENARIRPVLADQYGWLGRLEESLNWIHRTYPRMPNYYFYAMAVAPYYYPDAALSGTVDQIMSGSGGVIADIESKMGASSVNRDTPHYYTDFYPLARAYNLKFMAYEGGADLDYNSSTNVANRIAAHYDSRMKNATMSYLSMWNACGGDLFMYFQLSGGVSHFQWGMTDNMSGLASGHPKLAGAQQAASTDRRYFECAAPNESTGFFGYNPNGIIGTGVGLTGTYYSDNNFANIAKLKNNQSVVRVDPVVNFAWINYATGHPYPNLNSDGWVHAFSTKWIGQIQPKFSGAYRFEMELASGDSATAKVNGQSVLGTTVTLTAGVKYPIEITYQPNGAGGIARLWWSSTGGALGNQVRAIVPKNQLYPN